MSQYLCCRDLLVLEMYWKLPAKSFENFAMGLLWLKLSWASSGLWKFPSLKFRTGIIRNTSGNSEGPPRICQTKWYSRGSGINNRNDPNKKVHLLETFFPERVRELISCSRRPELMRYSDITSTSELASGLTSCPVITPPWHRGALININTTRHILAHKLLAVYVAAVTIRRPSGDATLISVLVIMCPRIIFCFMRPKTHRATGFPIFTPLRPSSTC